MGPAYKQPRAGDQSLRPMVSLAASEKGEVCGCHHTHLQLLSHWRCCGPPGMRVLSLHPAHPVPTLLPHPLGWKHFIVTSLRRSQPMSLSHALGRDRRTQLNWLGLVWAPHPLPSFSPVVVPSAPVVPWLRDVHPAGHGFWPGTSAQTAGLPAAFLRAGLGEGRKSQLPAQAANPNPTPAPGRRLKVPS